MNDCSAEKKEKVTERRRRIQRVKTVNRKISKKKRSKSE